MKFRSITKSRFLNKIKNLSSNNNVINTDNNENIITWQEEKEKFLWMGIEEKRKYYKCGKNYVTLDHIPTWRENFINNRQNMQDLNVLDRSFKIEKINNNKNRELSNKVSLWYGNMTFLEVEAIVVPGTTSLNVAGSVSVAVDKAAGPYLQMEKNTFIPCNVGKAKITGAYELPAKFIIHTARPMCEDPDLLKSCYEECLKIVDYHQFSSVAFPCISFGVTKDSHLEAARVATSVVRLFMENAGLYLQRIIFDVFTERDNMIYEKLMQIYFPC